VPNSGHFAQQTDDEASASIRQLQNWPNHPTFYPCRSSCHTIPCPGNASIQPQKARLKNSEICLIDIVVAIQISVFTSNGWMHPGARCTGFEQNEIVRIYISVVVEITFNWRDHSPLRHRD